MNPFTFTSTPPALCSMRSAARTPLVDDCAGSRVAARGIGRLRRSRCNSRAEPFSRTPLRPGTPVARVYEPFGGTMADPHLVLPGEDAFIGEAELPAIPPDRVPPRVGVHRTVSVRPEGATSPRCWIGGKTVTGASGRRCPFRRRGRRRFGCGCAPPRKPGWTFVTLPSGAEGRALTNSSTSRRFSRRRANPACASLRASGLRHSIRIGRASKSSCRTGMSLSGFTFGVQTISILADSGVADGHEPGVTTSGQCGDGDHVEALCAADPTALGKVASVGRILVEKAGGPAFCTGTLLNSRDASADPLTLGDGPVPYLLISNCLRRDAGGGRQP